MKLITLNTWGGAIHRPLLEYVRGADADIFCFQEVYNTPDPYAGSQILQDANGIEAHPDLYWDLTEELPGYNGLFWPAVSGYIHNSEGMEVPVFYGIAAFVRKSIPILESRTEFVWDRFRHVDFKEVPLPRNAHAFRVYDEESRSTALIAHFHGLYQRNGKQDSPEREVQWRNLLSLVDDMRLGSEKAIVCGDFNVLPSSRTLDAFTRAGFRELVTEYEYTSTRTSYYDKLGKFADYMFVTPSVEVDAFEVVTDPEVSDHCPLLLDFH